MARFIDITGEKYGKLIVLGMAEDRTNNVIKWKCLCDCGNTTYVRASNLKSGAVKSCGCLRKTPRYKHNMSNTKLYYVWNSMKNRCTNKNARSYSDYGGRGISVCEEWSRSFETFAEWAFKNGYAETLTIERKDNDKGYCPDNCTWIPKKDQVSNRRMNYKITYNGETKNLSQWCEDLGIDYFLVQNRIKKLHWDFEKAVTTPCNIKKRNRKARKECD